MGDRLWVADRRVGCSGEGGLRICRLVVELWNPNLFECNLHFINTNSEI